MHQIIDSPASLLCQACGLCCTGHLFSWTKLRSAELDTAEQLGLKVLRSVPSQRGFDQPCALWKGNCTIYESPGYPFFCRTYKCALLKKIINQNIELHEALYQVEQVKQRIDRLEALLPHAPETSFRERLAAELEASESPPYTSSEAQSELQQQASELLDLFGKVFGVSDVSAVPLSGKTR